MNILSKKKVSNPSGGLRTDEEGYTAFFRKYYPSLVYYAMRFLDREHAEDVVQDAFTDLWQRRDKIEAGDHLMSFMYRSVYTKAINKLRHRAVVENYGAAQIEFYRGKMDYFSPDNNEVLKKIEDNELGHSLEEVISQLPEKCREVFLLSYVHGLKNKEIAQAMGISLKTVEAHMHKALKILRSKLGHLAAYVLLLWLLG